jgi:membrane dipeptidase
LALIFRLCEVRMIRREFLSSLVTGAAGLAAAGNIRRPLSASPRPNDRTPLQAQPSPPGPEVSAKALALHKKAIIIDGHNDSLIEHWARKQSYDLSSDWPAFQVDLKRMKAGGLTAMNSMVGGATLVQDLDLWAGMYENVEKHARDFLLADKPGDILRAKAEGKVALIGQLEGCQLLSNSLRVLDVLRRLGVRVAGLTHGEGGGEFDLQAAKSPFGFCTQADRDNARRDPAGLTDFGRAAVAELNRLGVVVDLAHANDAAFFETLTLSKNSVEFSHGAVFAVSPHWRALTDDQLKALAANGGVIGIAVYPDFIDQDPAKRTMARFVDHVEYVCEKVGDDYVGFGADYDGMGDVTAVVPSHADMPKVTQLMLDRGFSEATILKFWGGNFLRVMRQAAA